MLTFHLKNIALSQIIFFAKCYLISFNFIIIILSLLRWQRLTKFIWFKAHIQYAHIF